MQRFAIFIFVAVLSVGFSRQARAIAIVVEEKVVASGFYDGAAFSNKLVTINGSVNSGTAEVDHPADGFASVKLIGNASVTVDGVSDTLNGQSRNLSNGLVFNGGFEIDSTALSVTGTTYTGADVGIENVILVLSTSNMTTDYRSAVQGAFGPVSGQAGISRGYQFLTTSGGYLELDSTSSSATVTIRVLPEPGSFVLCCLGTVGMALVARYRRRGC